MRAPRALLRRRIPLMRKRAELLPHVPHTTCQSPLPDIGTKSAYKTNRGGVAERFPDPAGQKSLEGALAWLDDDDRLRSDLALAIVKTAKQQDAAPCYRRQSVPGMGQILLSCGSRTSMTSTAARACRTACPTAAWSNGRRNPQERGPARPAPRWATPSAKGHVPKRPCCAYGPTRWARRIVPVWSQRMVRARPEPGARRSWRGRCMTGENAGRHWRCRSFSTTSERSG